MLHCFLVVHGFCVPKFICSPSPLNKWHNISISTLQFESSFFNALNKYWVISKLTINIASLLSIKAVKPPAMVLNIILLLNEGILLKCLTFPT